MNGRIYTAMQINKFIRICKAKGEPFKIGQEVIIDVKSMKSKQTCKTVLVGMTEQGIPVSIDPSHITPPSLGYSKTLERELYIGDYVFIKGSKSRHEVTGLATGKDKTKVWMLSSGRKVVDNHLRPPVLTEGWVIFDSRYADSSCISSSIYSKEPNANWLRPYHIVVPITYEC